MTVFSMTIKELYEYTKENGIEDKQLVAVCFENGCVLIDDDGNHREWARFDECKEYRCAEGA